MWLDLNACWLVFFQWRLKLNWLFFNCINVITNDFHTPHTAANPHSFLVAINWILDPSEPSLQRAITLVLKDFSNMCNIISEKVETSLSTIEQKTPTKIPTSPTGEVRKKNYKSPPKKPWRRPNKGICYVWDLFEQGARRWLYCI